MSKEDEKLSLFEEFAEEIDDMCNLNATEMSRVMVLAKAKADIAKEKSANKTRFYDLIRFYLLPDLMEEEGIEGIKVAGVGRVNLQGDMWVSTRKGSSLELIQWLKDNGFEDIPKEGVNASTLKAWVKEQKLAGSEIPEELLNITPFTRASITKT